MTRIIHFFFHLNFMITFLPFWTGFFMVPFLVGLKFMKSHFKENPVSSFLVFNPAEQDLQFVQNSMQFLSYLFQS